MDNVAVYSMSCPVNLHNRDEQPGMTARKSCVGSLHKVTGTPAPFEGRSYVHSIFSQAHRPNSSAATQRMHLRNAPAPLHAPNRVLRGRDDRGVHFGPTTQNCREQLASPRGFKPRLPRVSAP